MNIAIIVIIMIMITLITIIINNFNYQKQGKKDTKNLTRSEQANIETNDYDPSPTAVPFYHPTLF